jgi:exodeoxyribonuclease VII large subunit
MMQLPLFEKLLWTVTDITRYLRDLLEGDEILQDVWVQGEVSNFSRPGSGHIYFTIKDNNSSLRCVMWRSAVARQTALPRDGEAVEVHGSINVYEVAGQYQLYADLIRPAGLGILYQEFVRLKARLEAEGLFDPERKRPLPLWPHKIGIVSSPTGAALRDILNTIQRRYPLVQVILAPTAVQGDEAPGGIVAAIQGLNEFVHPDVIILARGGGSIEDLWAFNDEIVARAIAASQAPIISGVGHETDFTIADFVSDVRAPTPTAAAEIVTPDRIELESELKTLVDRNGRAFGSILNFFRMKLDRIENQLAIRSPMSNIRSDRQRLDELFYRANLALAHFIQLHKLQLNSLELRLLSLNPYTILQRGYSIITTRDGKLVRSVVQVNQGDALEVEVSDGMFGVGVQQSNGNKQELYGGKRS